MIPDCSYLIEKTGLQYPIIGLYDTPNPSYFEPLVKPSSGRWACAFMFFNRWLKNESVHLTADNHGCGGIGTYLFGLETRSRKEYIDFLCGEEGLKASGDLMGQWIDKSTPYKPQYSNIVIGPLKNYNYDQLKSVTFYVNPDQLSLFVIGAYYHQGPNDPPIVSAPFASGCGMLLPCFNDLNKPEAIIGSMDIAMRKYLPPDILAFTVTKPMYELLCSLDEKSFLNKAFWKDLQKARKKS